MTRSGPVTPQSPKPLIAAACQACKADAEAREQERIAYERKAYGRKAPAPLTEFAPCLPEPDGTIVVVRRVSSGWGYAHETHRFVYRFNPNLGCYVYAFAR